MGEPPEHGAALFTFQVDGQTALVAIETCEVATLSRRYRLEKPREIAGSGMLDLDDVRAEVGELHPAVRPRHVVADLDDANARKGRGA